MDNILLFCIVGLNIVTFIVYGIDKLKAKKGSGVLLNPHCSYWLSLAVA